MNKIIVNLHGSKIKDFVTEAKFKYHCWDFTDETSDKYVILSMLYQDYREENIDKPLDILSYYQWVVELFEDDDLAEFLFFSAKCDKDFIDGENSTYNVYVGDEIKECDGLKYDCCVTDDVLFNERVFDILKILTKN